LVSDIEGRTWAGGGVLESRFLREKFGANMGDITKELHGMIKRRKTLRFWQENLKGDDSLRIWA